MLLPVKKLVERHPFSQKFPSKKKKQPKGSNPKKLQDSLLKKHGWQTMLSWVRLGGVFALERGLPVTVDDDTLRDFYQDRARMPGATLDAEERVRRYKFSVMVTKLIEALYRRGYDLGGEFRMRVQACNSMSEQTTVEATRTREELREDVGIVEAAMKEALRIAYPDNDTFSFFSHINPPGNLKISVPDFQSFYVSKSKKKITGEMVHLGCLYIFGPH